MQNTTTTAVKKYKSLKDLAAALPNKTNAEKWQDFLTIKGHSPETFSYLPENLQTDLKFSFSRKY